VLWTINQFVLQIDYSNLASSLLSKVNYISWWSNNDKDVVDLYYEPHKENEVWQMITSAVDMIMS